MIGPTPPVRCLVGSRVSMPRSPGMGIDVQDVPLIRAVVDPPGGPRTARGKRPAAHEVSAPVFGSSFLPCPDLGSTRAEPCSADTPDTLEAWLRYVRPAVPLLHSWCVLEVLAYYGALAAIAQSLRFQSETGQLDTERAVASVVAGDLADPRQPEAW